MEQETKVSICEQLGVTVKFTFVPLSQAKARKLFDWLADDECKLCYECEVYKDGVFVYKTPFATGSEIPDWVHGPFFGKDIWKSTRRRIKEIVCETGECVPKPRDEVAFFSAVEQTSLGTLSFWRGWKPKPIVPNPDTVLWCLVGDAQCAYYARTFQEFCADLGYNDDSIKALKTYEASKEVLISLMRHFDFEQLCKLFEDY